LATLGVLVLRTASVHLGYLHQYFFEMGLQRNKAPRKNGNHLLFFLGQLLFQPHIFCFLAALRFSTCGFSAGGLLIRSSAMERIAPTISSVVFSLHCWSFLEVLHRLFSPVGVTTDAGMHITPNAINI